MARTEQGQRVVQEAGQLHTLSGLVIAGVGVSSLPNAIARGAGSTPRLPLHVGWREGELSPTGRHFVEVARELGG